MSHQALSPANTNCTSAPQEEELFDIADLYEKASNHVLKIDVNETLSAYGSEVNSTASGFWLGGKSRFIVTNAHVAAPSQISRMYAEDVHGRRFKVKLVYSNPLIDLAYLQPEDDETILPPQTQFTFNTQPQRNLEVFMIGNNGGGGIVLQDGRISDICAISTSNYPRKVFSVSINGKGGSSGSMVVDYTGVIVGVNHAGSDIANYVIPAEFVLEDLHYLEAGHLPPKKDIGLTFAHIREGEAKTFYKYKPDENVVQLGVHSDALPGAQSRLLRVNKCLPGSPGEQIFQPGDIITHVENVAVGQDLFKYYHRLNTHEGDTIQITFFRSGEKRMATVPLFDLNEANCHEMVVFGKAIFSKASPIISHLFGIEIGKVGLFQNPNGNIFSDSLSCVVLDNKYYSGVCFDKIDNVDIHTLDDVEEIIPYLTQIRCFSYTFRNHANGYQKASIDHVEYDETHHQAPVRMTFDLKKAKWTRKQIAV